MNIILGIKFPPRGAGAAEAIARTCIAVDKYARRHLADWGDIFKFEKQSS